jgi:hypothetical protein
MAIHETMQIAGDVWVSTNGGWPSVSRNGLFKVDFGDFAAGYANGKGATGSKYSNTTFRPVVWN